MTGRFAANGIAWETLFDPDIVGDGPQALSFTDDGTPMRFAALAYGQKRADIGFTVLINGADVDVTNLWAAAGTAQYVNAAAVPGLVRHEMEGSPPSVSAGASIAFNRNGTVTFQPVDYLPTNYVLNASPSVGDGYRIRFRLLSRTPQGDLTGTLDAFMTLDQSRQIAMSYTRTNAGSFTAWAELAIDLQRVSDGAILHTWNARLEASAAIT